MQLHEELNLLNYCEISGFRREEDENCALLDYHAACSRYLLSTFRENLSVPFSRVKNPRIFLIELLLLLKLLCQIPQSLITNICCYNACVINTSTINITIIGSIYMNCHKQ
jgi:hypothetical protein